MAAKNRVEVEIVATDEASPKLEHVERQMEALEADPVNIKADTTGLDNLGRSASSSKSVLANMVGNSTQDLSALGGVAGSAGVAIGQMGEYMADASASGEGLTSILRNFAGVAGPIAAITVAMAGIQDIMKSMSEGQAAEKAFDKKQIEQFTEAIKTGTDATETYAETLAETGEVLAETGAQAGPAWAAILPGVGAITKSLTGLGKFGQEIENILPKLNEAGISAERWTSIVTAGADDQVAQMDKLRGALERINISDEKRHELLIAARNAQDNYTTSLERTAEVEKFFGDGVTVPTKFEEPDVEAFMEKVQAALDKVPVKVNTTPVASNGLQLNSNAFVPAGVTNNYYHVPGSPPETVRQIGLYETRNSSRTGG
jgi:uncharacterized protein YukE